jgi:hypothetical protein
VEEAATPLNAAIPKPKKATVIFLAPEATAPTAAVKYVAAPADDGTSLHETLESVSSTVVEDATMPVAIAISKPKKATVLFVTPEVTIEQVVIAATAPRSAIRREHDERWLPRRLEGLIHPKLRSIDLRDGDAAPPVGCVTRLQQLLFPRLKSIFIRGTLFEPGLDD